MGTAPDPQTEPTGEDAAIGPASAPPAKPRRVSMHEGIAVWADCCSCAAEPYWLEVAEEMGIDLGSDYETEVKDEDTTSER